MPSPIEAVLDEAENRYLKPEELKDVATYVMSLPDRADAYRAVRDNELTVMQQVADQLQAELPRAATAAIEHSLKNGILVLRYCAMSMLLDDETFVQTRLLNWLSESIQTQDAGAIDAALYPLMIENLTQTLTSKQLTFLEPLLTLAQNALLQSAQTEMLTVAAMF
jgi:hypothetical protein